MSEETQELYEKALHTWGPGSQLNILQEECAELIQAASKLRRAIVMQASEAQAIAVSAYQDSLAEEMADVTIMIEQMFVSLVPASQFEAWKQKKLNRLEQVVDNVIKERQKNEENNTDSNNDGSLPC